MSLKDKPHENSKLESLVKTESEQQNSVSVSSNSSETECLTEDVLEITPVYCEISLSNGQCAAVSQFAENTEINSFYNNGTNKKKSLELRREMTRSENNQSLAIPEGLVMDPLAPTALAVSTEFMDRIGSGLTLLRDHGKKVQKYVWKNRKLDILKKTWKSSVNIVLIEARGLPDGPAGSLYCKYRLGNETHKSRQVSNSKPLWCERFTIHIYEETYLEVTLWLKGKQKNFMGRCSIDLSKLKKEKTHDLWQELECGYGSIHMLLTVNGSAGGLEMDNVPTTTSAHVPPPQEQYSWYRFDNGMGEVGELSITVLGARGLSALSIGGKADSFCVLELHNSRVQTHTVKGTTEPTWNKSFNLPVHDITSTIEITVYDDAPIKEVLGKVAIPLLRINNTQPKWYALKDRSKKASARGNCPRIQLQMSIVWNPIKASLRVLSPKEQIYTDKKENTFNIPMIYSNLKFIKDIFSAVELGNEHFKYLFEWDNREVSALALVAWLTFWFFFHMWMTPLLLLLPFLYYLIVKQKCNFPPICSLPDTPITEIEESDEIVEAPKDDKTLKARLYGLQDLTLTIKNGIDYICSLLERVQNLANFTVPYLSYLAMIALISLTAAFYFMPANYLFMAFGIYKFGRKALNPERVPNNDILDFLSRVPDNATLKEWRELKIPEPVNSNGSRSSKAESS